jgi:hypothetical protein
MQLEIGDFWTVALSSGNVGVLQVRDVIRAGPGARKSFVAGVVDWRGSTTPTAADLRGRRVLAQGRTSIAVFTEGGAQILGHAPDTVPVPGLTSSFRDFSVGTKVYVWGWAMLTDRVERALAETS